MTLVQGHRYRIKGTKREGLVIGTEGDFAQWCEMVENWPFPASPIQVPAKSLERVKMRDARGDPVDLPDALF